jgi:hypothetical protein
MARRLAFIITTLTAVALTACSNPTSPAGPGGATPAVCGGGATNGSSTCS